MCTQLLRAQEYVIVIHGGAGDGIVAENFSKEKRARYENQMKEALQIGTEVLDTGGSAVDAVVEVIKILEDSPLFNAGKGAVLNWNGDAELDASIMDGSQLRAGAVAGIRRVKSPVSLARRVMDSSAHVMLSGKGAEEFAETEGMEMVSPSYFKTESRERSLQKYKDKFGLISTDSTNFSKYGTVGCVVMDKEGHIAAATSTGGMTGKRYGRIGDSPIIGAGTYASDETCGISCTGHGEFFIRYAVAYDLHARVKFNQQSLQEAAAVVIQEELLAAGGKGGIIGIDKKGRIVMEFNTNGMFRAFVREGEPPEVYMFK